jgi:hypothetical protein
MSAQHFPLTDSQLSFLVQALQIAKAQFVQDAEFCRKQERMSAQFMRQAAEAEQLVQLLDGADVVVS